MTSAPLAADVETEEISQVKQQVDVVEPDI